jgi:hypothetical protein
MLARANFGWRLPSCRAGLVSLRGARTIFGVAHKLAAPQQNFDRALSAGSTQCCWAQCSHVGTSFVWRLPLLSCRSLPAWAKTDWDDNDLFKLSVPELEVLKLRVAVCLKCRYKGNVSGDFGLEVGGMKPLDPEASEPQRRDRSGKVKEVHSIPG